MTNNTLAPVKENLQPSNSNFELAEIKAALPQVDYVQARYLIDGTISTWEGDKTSVYSPFTINGQQIALGSYPELSPEAALSALNSASNAYANGLGEWPQMTPEARINAVEKFTDMLSKERLTIAKLIMLEIAKPMKASLQEVDRTIQYIKDTIAAYRVMLEKDACVEKHADGLKTHIERTPLGVVLCLGPFNYPFNETLTSLIPALIMGNTCVMKPARFGTLLFDPILKAFAESFPTGVANIIYGDGAKVITPLMESGKVDVLAFIGSTRVANILSRQHPEPHRLTRVLGLGAHNPLVIMPGTDVAPIIPQAITSSLSFNGQRCTTTALHFVHTSQASEYAALIADQVSKLKIGLPWEKDVQITALVEGPKKIAYLKELIDDAVQKGARVINPGGGEVSDNTMTPAVLFPVTSDMRIFTEEQFGPILPIVEYQNLDDVVKTVAGAKVGQQISIYGADENKLHSIINILKNSFGRININSQCQRGPDKVPFAGKKDSGLGVLSVTEALTVFSLPTVIAEKP